MTDEMMSQPDLQEGIAGVFLGTAVGDALGLPAEGFDTQSALNAGGTGYGGKPFCFRDAACAAMIRSTHSL
jgi:ADP-ribosylglycohydrolase